MSFTVCGAGHVLSVKSTFVEIQSSATDNDSAATRVVLDLSQGWPVWRPSICIGAALSFTGDLTGVSEPESTLPVVQVRVLRVD